MIKKQLLFLLTGLMSGVVNAMSVEDYDVSKSWENAVAYVPYNFFPKKIDSVQVEKPLPVVILLHGCGGIGEHEKRWAQNLTYEGFIVVLPDSFSIPNRQSNCIPATNTRNIGQVPVHDLRPAEAEFAMRKISDQVWADKQNIFLMGHSEGGMGAFLTKEIGFKGVVISGFPCEKRRKVGSSDTTPFIAINWEIDPYFSKNEIPQMQCSNRPFWGNRNDRTEIILKGKGHATAYEDSANSAVIKFLKDRLTSSVSSN